MKIRSILFVVSAVFALATITACGESGGESSDDSPGDSSVGSIALEARTNRKIGFTIQAPVEGKVLADSEFGYTVSQTLPGGLHEVKVSVNPAEEMESVDAFRRDLKTMMVENIVEAWKTSNGFLAVEEKFGLVTVYHRAGELQAKITVPPEFRKLAETIALSLEAH